MEDTNKIREQFLAISIDPKVVDDILKNKKVVSNLSKLLLLGGVTQSDKVVGNLLY
jgi:hypothetical protein